MSTGRFCYSESVSELELNPRRFLFHCFWRNRHRLGTEPFWDALGFVLRVCSLRNVKPIAHPNKKHTKSQAVTSDREEMRCVPRVPDSGERIVGLAPKARSPRLPNLGVSLFPHYRSKGCWNGSGLTDRSDWLHYECRRTALKEISDSQITRSKSDTYLSASVSQHRPPFPNPNYFARPVSMAFFFQPSAENQTSQSGDNSINLSSRRTITGISDLDDTPSCLSYLTSFSVSPPAELYITLPANGHLRFDKGPAQPETP